MANTRLSHLLPALRLTPASRSDSRSPTRSPERKHTTSYQTIDPLLSNLSPESTLEALTSTNAVPTNEKDSYDILSNSISQVSPGERALGIRAAIAAQRLGWWYKEIQTWEWPTQGDSQHGKGFIPPTPDELGSSLRVDAGTEYYGSLPAQVVKQHEERIEEIRDGMDGLDVEELKEHVLSAHIPSWSRPSSSNSSMPTPPPLSYVQLSDFTAVVTATILRALPLLSRLNSLLSTWDVRLLVVRQIPGLLRGLHETRTELDSSLNSLKSTNHPGEHDAVYSSANFRAKKAELEAMVLSVGRRMDRILDGLEGREDSLPENWIDDLEAIESDFGTWVMDAERRTAENEWNRIKTAEQDDARRHAEQESDGLPVISETPEESSVHEPDAVRQNSWSTPMETIDEEPGCMPEPASSHEQRLPIESSAISSVETAATTSDPAEANALPKPPPALQCDDHDIDLPEEIGVPTESTVPIIAREDSLDSERQLLSEQPTTDPEEENSSLPREGLPPPASSDQLEEPSLSSDTKEECKALVRSDSAHISSDNGEQHHLDAGNVACDEDNASQLSPNVMGANMAIGPDNAPSESKNESSEASKLGNDEQGYSHAVQAPQTADEGRTPVASVTAEAGTAKIPMALDSVNADPLPSTDCISKSGASPEVPPSSNLGDKQSGLSSILKRDDESPPVKHTLESPIKLSKTRHRQSSPEKGRKKTRRRRTSNTSADSTFSDYPSLVSSPEFKEAYPASSNETLFLKTPPHYQTDYQPARLSTNYADHSLREDRLFRLDSQKSSPQTPFAHNRTVSLPLQRFINERMEMNHNDHATIDGESSSGRRASVTSADGRSRGQGVSTRKGASTTPTNNGRSSRRTAASRKDEQPRGPTVGGMPNASEHNKNAYLKNSAHHPLPPDQPSHPNKLRLSKRPVTQIGVNGTGVHKSHAQLMGEGSGDSASDKTRSRSSTPVKQLRKPKDHLDEKISSILSTLPGGIHLVSPVDQELDSSPGTSSLLPTRERVSSASPQIPSRDSVPASSPAPSITLTPALSARRRYSHSHGPEESSVKVYHLYRGGKSVPTKLFVRTIGENGGRVMVRVGGGWADLGEYLREYAIHHGRRSITETPRVEVKGLSPNNSPGYVSASERHPPRPQSVISTRPASSISVRKKRRPSNVSDVGDVRATSGGEALNTSFSPFSSLSNRRLSVSSNASVGATSSASEALHRSFTPSTSVPSLNGSTPLGLAGPKPRSRQVSMSPQSEAWVENVLGKARRSSSLNPHKFGMGVSEGGSPAPTTRTLPKAKSISDIASVGQNKRVVLRGLGDRRH